MVVLIARLILSLIVIVIIILILKQSLKEQSLIQLLYGEPLGFFVLVVVGVLMIAAVLVPTVVDLVRWEY